MSQDTRSFALVTGASSGSGGLAKRCRDLILLARNRLQALAGAPAGLDQVEFDTLPSLPSETDWNSEAAKEVLMPTGGGAANSRKRIALVAHDRQKSAMVAWAKLHRDILEKCELWATGATGGQVAKETGLALNLVRSGPLGGDQQLGAMVAEGRLDILIFFTDPLAAMPHDADVKALLRICILSQTLLACNRATADVVIASPRGWRVSIASGCSSSTWSARVARWRPSIGAKMLLQIVRECARPAGHKAAPKKNPPIDSVAETSISANYFCRSNAK